MNYDLSYSECNYILKLIDDDMRKTNCDFGCPHCNVAESIASKLLYPLKPDKREKAILQNLVDGGTGGLPPMHFTIPPQEKEKDNG